MIPASMTQDGVRVVGNTREIAEDTRVYMLKNGNRWYGKYRGFNAHLGGSHWMQMGVGRGRMVSDTTVFVVE